MSALPLVNLFCAGVSFGIALICLRDGRVGQFWGNLFAATLNSFIFGYWATVL